MNMLRFAFLAALALTSPAFSAVGDVTVPIVDVDGSSAIVKVLGVAGGGTYATAFGMGENNNPELGSPSIVLNVASPGFDAAGNPITRNRVVYGTRTMRKVWSPTGDNLTPDETVSGSDLIIRFSLSHQVFASDTATITVQGGWYTKSGVPSNPLTNATVTVNSTLPYPKVVGNWSWPGYEKIGATHTLRMFATHGWGQDGSQVAAVKFTSSDTSGHTVTTFATEMTCDSSFGDAVPVIEYTTTYDSSGFQQNDIVTSNFVAYPFIGDTAACLDTTVGGTAQPHFWYGPITGVADPGGTYSGMMAVVDPVSGVDTSNVITAADTSVEAANSHPFLTLAKANDSLRVYMNSLGRNNPGGCTIYLKAGTYTWQGAATQGTTPDCWTVVHAYPGVPASSVIFNNGTAPKYVSLRCKLVGVTVDTSTGSTPIFDSNTGTGVLWTDQCIINNPTGAARQVYFRNKVIHITRCQITRLNEGIAPSGVTDTEFSIVRGNTISEVNSSIICQMFIGNRYSSTSTTGRLVDYLAGSNLPNNGQLRDNIVACNLWFASANPVLNFRTTNNAYPKGGLAIVQNVFESRAVSVSPVFQIHADTTLNTPVDEVYLIGNTIVGQRCNIGYNDHGSVKTDLRNWYIIGNIFQDTNCKSDSFLGNAQTAGNLVRTGTRADATSTAHGYQAGDYVYITGASPAAYNGYFQVLASPAPTANTFSYTMLSDPGANNSGSWVIGPSANRTGNWAVYYGCGSRGNFDCKSVLTAFIKLYPGIRCYQPPQLGTSDPPQATATNPYTFPQFVNFAAYNGSTAGAGNGDYHLTESSPAAMLCGPEEYVLKYDISGQPRTSTGSPGAYQFTLAPSPTGKQKILKGIKSNIIQ